VRVAPASDSGVEVSEGGEVLSEFADTLVGEEIDSLLDDREAPPTSFVPVARGPRLPVLAHIPTITRLSRSALFAGKALTPGESLDTGRDAERLASHPAVRRMGEAPVVLLRAGVLGEGGGLSDDAARAVRGEQRVVAVVVNAIDDQLKGSAQLRVTLSTEHIRPLRALLDAAESTGRLLLLVSDHGNISSQRFVGEAVRVVGVGGKEREGMERGARHRGLEAGESAAPDEIALPAGALLMPKGKATTELSGRMSSIGTEGGVRNCCPKSAPICRATSCVAMA